MSIFAILNLPSVTPRPRPFHSLDSSTSWNSEALGPRGPSLAEKIAAQFLKPCARTGRIEINPSKQSINFNVRLRQRRDRAQASQRPLTRRQVFPVLALKFRHKIIHQLIVKSSPPKFVSPAVALSSKMPSSILRATHQTCLRPNQRSTYSYSTLQSLPHLSSPDALRIIEIRRHRQDGILHLLATERFGKIAHLVLPVETYSSRLYTVPRLGACSRTHSPLSTTSALISACTSGSVNLRPINRFASRTPYSRHSSPLNSWPRPESAAPCR
ncbi:hypothetical protein PsorP6_013312 [Peronosclerospora sorghi]|uniref:Uncharacterized protein n=1 Tax=Peronosclerospora sorghi TaxID=230839 RepID=A0ACC0WEZ4_9STRA|nr:hypothetical protein PsorP6_013312 [Peronosclerospora sorghi]